MDNLTVGNSIILLLYEIRNRGVNGVFPIESTQLGVSEALGIHRNHAGVELNKLVKLGYVVAIDAWVKHTKGQRKVYRLTPSGLEFVRLLAEVASVDLSAGVARATPPEENWLLEAEMHMDEDRPKPERDAKQFMRDPLH